MRNDFNVPSRVPVFLLTILSVLFLLVGPSAQSLYGDAIQLKNGKIVKGKVEKLTEDKVVINQTTGDGEKARISISLDDVLPSSVYRLRIRYGTVSSPADHYELARFCLENNLFVYAREHFKKSAAKGKGGKYEKKGSKGLKKIDRKEAATLYLKGVSEMDRKKYGEAIDRFQELLRRFPGSNHASKARKKVQEITNILRQDDEKSKKQGGKSTKKEIKTRIRSFVEAGKQQIKNGYKMEADQKYASAFSRYEDAVAQFKTARFSIRNNLSKPRWKGEKKFKETLRDYDETAKEQLKQVYTTMAELYSLEGDIESALKWVNKTLALEPMYEPARKLKRLIIRNKLENSEVR